MGDSTLRQVSCGDRHSLWILGQRHKDLDREAYKFGDMNDTKPDIELE